MTAYDACSTFCKQPLKAKYVVANDNPLAIAEPINGTWRTPSWMPDFRAYSARKAYSCAVDCIDASRIRPWVATPRLRKSLDR